MEVDCNVNVTSTQELNSSYPSTSRIDDLVVVPVAWGVLIITGVIGNGLVIYVMLRHGERKATNCYIVNLALTDLAFILIVVPFTMMHYVLPSWILGVALCRLHMYMIFVTLQATCLTLTAMTIDRYYAIVHPIRSIERRTPRRAVLVSGGIWLVSFVTYSPLAVLYGVRNTCWASYCRAIWPPIVGKVTIVSVVTLTYVIPLSIIIVCYTLMIRHLYMKATVAQLDRNVDPVAGVLTIRASQSRTRKLRKTSKMVAVVVLLFATFWLPIHVFQLWFILDDNFPRTDATYRYKIAAHALSYANSCVNPCVYSFLGDGFRKALRKAFPVSRPRQVRSLSVFPAKDGDRGTSSVHNTGGHDSGTPSPVAGPSHHRANRLFLRPSPQHYLRATSPAMVAGRPVGTGSFHGSDAEPVVVLRPREECAVFTHIGASSTSRRNPLPAVFEVESVGSRG